MTLEPPLHPSPRTIHAICVFLFRNWSVRCGIGASAELAQYYREPAVILFPDGAEWRRFDIDLYVAPPDEGVDYLPSLLGRDVLNAVRMEYDFPAGRLEFQATAAR